MRKKELIILIVIFLIALSLRGIALYRLYNSDYFAGIRSGLDASAHNLFLGNGFSKVTQGKLTPDFQQLPGYSFLLAMTYKIFGHESDIYLQIIQILLSSCSVFIIFGIAKRFFNKNIALVSSFLWAIWLPEIRLSVAVLYDTSAVFLTLLACYLFFKSVVDNKKYFWIYAAIIIGISLYFRSDSLLLPLFLGIGSWIYKRNWKAALGKTLTMFLIIFTILFPWGIRNYLVFHTFTFGRATLWQSMWEGFGEFKNPFGAVLSDGVTYEQVAQEYPGIDYASPQYQDVLKTKVIQAIKTHPGWYILMMPKRLISMLFTPRGMGSIGRLLGEHFTRQFFFDHNPGSSNIDYGKWLLRNNFRGFLLVIIIPALIQGLFVLAAAFGFWFTKQQWRKNLLLLSPLLYFYLSHVPIYWEARYLVPGEFPYLIFMAYFCVHIFNVYKQKYLNKPELKRIKYDSKK